MLWSRNVVMAAEGISMVGCGGADGQTGREMRFHVKAVGSASWQLTIADPGWTLLGLPVLVNSKELSSIAADARSHSTGAFHRVALSSLCSHVPEMQ